jgi:hypothetical protein
MPWLSSEATMQSSDENGWPNIVYESDIGGGGSGAVPRRTASSVYSMMNCIGGKGIELTCRQFGNI